MTTAPPADISQLIDQFWETIPSTWNGVRLQIHTIANQKFDVSEDQWHILRHIHRGVASVSDLAAKKSITRSAMSQAVDILVEKDLVERQHSLTDRRYVELRLTPAGAELVQAIFQSNRAWMAEQMTHLTSEEIDVMIRGLRLLKQTFQHDNA